MDRIAALLEQHTLGASLLALLLVIIGLYLRLKRYGYGSNAIRAESGSVVVRRDNYGAITTGNSAGGKTGQTSRDWIDITGAIVAILGAIIAAAAWLFPGGPG